MFILLAESALRASPARSGSPGDCDKGIPKMCVKNIISRLLGFRGVPHTLGVLSAQVVLSQLKMSNLGRGGPGESIDTHIVGVWNKKYKVTFGYPRCPQCPGGPESAQNVKSWKWGSRGVLWYPYCLVSKEIFLSAQMC